MGVAPAHFSPRARNRRHPMASSGSVKGGAMLRSGSLRQVSVRGFENLAQGDSTLFRPEAGSNADVDEAYIVAARAATLKLQMGNAKATAAKSSDDRLAAGRGPSYLYAKSAPGSPEISRSAGASRGLSAQA